MLTSCPFHLRFLPPQNRLASLTNKCHGDEDLEYYVMEAGHILGLKLPENANAKVGTRVRGLCIGRRGGASPWDGVDPRARGCARKSASRASSCM